MKDYRHAHFSLDADDTDDASKGSSVSLAFYRVMRRGTDTHPYYIAGVAKAAFTNSVISTPVSLLM